MALFLLTAQGVACGRVEQARQCRGLAAIVNPALDTIEQRRSSGGETPATLRDLAGQYDQLALALGRQSFIDHELQKLVADHAKLFRSVAHNLRALASALERAERPREQRIRSELDNLVRKQAILVRRIDHVCHGT